MTNTTVTVKIKLGRRAADAIKRRGGGDTALSTSTLVNTIVNRYSAMVEQEYPSIQKKFRTHELKALQRSFALVPDASRRLSNLETVSDLVLFPVLFEEGHDRLPEEEKLTKRQLGELIQMLTTTITMTELSALSDRIIAYVNERGE